ncbi:hypothetical protein HOP50_03g26230 [Chloropicon primus]|uniref:Uncharacterized protein n=1 Tax=Chloropicon primus TaxID=1764295 RepID=A0A5B8MJ30_9CHLO|nr:hypothetical protein A3770_03p26220 [Chloropicon primus]UPQ99316.1 hypothetical protein HOP50_03g26230 [Chloropicon primus]|eukprot:QDZ20104.1 hypothetical protein A3770_03p26220 [Chloropicon primus]
MPDFDRGCAPLDAYAVGLMAQQRQAWSVICGVWASLPDDLVFEVVALKEGNEKTPGERAKNRPGEKPATVEEEWKGAEGRGRSALGGRDVVVQLVVSAT